MSPEDRLTAFGEQVGFDVRVVPDVIRAVGVPCLLKDGVVGTCTIEKSRDPASGKPNDRIGAAVHAVRIVPDEAKDGCVYNADGTRIGNYIRGDEKTWSNISIRKGSQGSPEEDESASDLVHRYAKQIVGAAWAAGDSGAASPAMPNPWGANIPSAGQAALRRPVGPSRARSSEASIARLGRTKRSEDPADMTKSARTKGIAVFV